MSLIVEDGAGLANADSLVSLAEADAYHLARASAAWSNDTAAKEAALRRASNFLTLAFTWSGYKRNGRAQRLAWPRYDVIDGEGYSVRSDAVPQEIKDATCEIALRELTSPGSMSPDVDMGSRIKSESVAGAVSVTYELATAPAASRPVLLIVRDLIAPFLRAGSGNMLVGTSYRT